MKFSQKPINIFLVTIGLFSIFYLLSLAWADAPIIKPQTTSYQIAGSVSPKSQSLSKEPESRAPEPSTLLLFGSGVFTMIMSFLRRAYHVTKRIIDIVISIIAVVILMPLCLIVTVLIKLTSRGPIFYSQTRAGKDGLEFEIYKFRTMKIDAEKESGPVWAVAQDDRITPIGKFLRKSRIDEIPQFINVLKGDMSVIGPRPERPIFVKKLEGQIGDYRKRLVVKPGITGLAQVYHRYDETIDDVRKKVKYDILYIKKICLLTDLRIIMRTFGVILTGFGAR